MLMPTWAVSNELSLITSFADLAILFWILHDDSNRIRDTRYMMRDKLNIAE